MRRFVLAAFLFLFALPFGASIAGCGKGATITYCNGSDYGPQVGQTEHLDLEPRLTGISLNQGAIGSIASPTATDCRGNASGGGVIVYATSNRSIVDINPSTGANGLCAGSWNRNTGAGIANYTICTPGTVEGVAQITATVNGVVSNPINVYVHPVVTSIVLGTPSTDCAADPASNCYNLSTEVCDNAGPAAGGSYTAGNPYTGTACISQGTAAQLAARVYAGTGTAQANISCQVGPLAFTPQNGSVVTVATNGVATATQPGSTIISVGNSQASSSAGSFSTCPPAKIVLSGFGSTTAPTAPINVAQNVAEPLVVTVTDTKGVPMTNVTLTYVSTTPVTIPTSSNDVVPAFPGAATITAICEPPTCNASPENMIGQFGNGLPVLSNPVQVTASGTTSATALYVGSTGSQYLLPVNTNATTQQAAIRLPYAPNSMVLSEDGTALYMGTANEIMVVSTSSNVLSRQDTSISGNVLSVSPNNATVVVTDPVRQLVYLYNATGGVSTEYGGVAERAIWSPDSSTVYIPTTDGRMLVHNFFTGWTAVALTEPANDIALTVPQTGVYLAANPVEIYTNCPAIGTTGVQNYPPAGLVAGASASNIAATNDGLHMLTANYTAAGTTGTAAGTLTDIGVSPSTGSCPFSFTNTPGAPLPLTGVTLVPQSATQNGSTANTNTDPITGILPTSDSAFAFVTYAGTGSVVPQYVPATGALTNITLQTTSAGAPTAPVAGVVSSDNQTFYVGTSGDNLVHVLKRGTTGFTDSGTPLIPALPSFSGSGFALPNLIAQHPIKSNS